MSEQKVCASTGASFNNFKRWQRWVLMHVARQRMQISSTDAEIDQVVDKLAQRLVQPGRRLPRLEPAKR